MIVFLACVGGCSIGFILSQLLRYVFKEMFYWGLEESGIRWRVRELEELVKQLQTQRSKK